jgi:hypothetical protein
MSAARTATAIVRLDGLPAVVATGECLPPEPEVGISWWTVDSLDWRPVSGELTPEQGERLFERCAEIEDAVIAAYHERRDAALSLR